MMRQVSHKHIVYLYGVCVRDLESKYPCLLDIGPCGVQSAVAPAQASGLSFAIGDLVVLSRLPLEVYIVD